MSYLTKIAEKDWGWGHISFINWADHGIVGCNTSSSEPAPSNPHTQCHGGSIFNSRFVSSNNYLQVTANRGSATHFWASIERGGGNWNNNRNTRNVISCSSGLNTVRRE